MSLGYVHKIRVTAMDHETFFILNDLFHTITANKGKVIDRRDYGRYEFDITLPAQMDVLPIIKSDATELFGIDLDKYSKVHIVYNSNYHTSCGEVIYTNKNPCNRKDAEKNAEMRRRLGINPTFESQTATLLKWRICYDSKDPEVIYNLINDAPVTITKHFYSVYHTVGFLNNPRVSGLERIYNLNRSYVDKIGAAVIKEFFSVS